MGKANFDVASSRYDKAFTFSNIGKAQRQRVYNYLNTTIKNKQLSVLELNCGTGEDAITLGNLEHHVTATDISEGMINKAKAKKHPKNVNFKIQDINTIKLDSFQTKFDIIFSNFGGLNCLSKEELTQFIETSTELLNPNGRLIMVIMPKNCLWELLYFSLKGEFKKAKRRNTTNSVIANVEGIDVKTWYYNPKEILKLTNLNYSKVKIKPIGIAIPPSYLESSFVSNKMVLKFLIFLENLIGFNFLAKYADHFFMELIKKS